jgi:sulfotransferase family protein
VTAQTVWLASYPKSGNTWLRAVCTAWSNDGPIDLNALAGRPLASNRESFDVALGIPSSSLTAAEIDLLRPRVDELIAAEAPAPLLRKVHDAYRLEPDSQPIVSVPATRGAVYVIRDPREVAVSYAHFMGRPFAWAQRRLNDPEAALQASDDRLHAQLRQRLGTWSQHVRSWVDEPPFPVEVVRYEDFAAAPVETFGRALRFAGFPEVDDARVADAVERASFERLRRAEDEGGFGERPAKTANFFRSGRPGSWRDELPTDLAGRIREEHGEVMARFGYR